MTAADDLDRWKASAASAALEWLLPRLTKASVVGIGTGSTADRFIDLLADHRGGFAGAVASSTRSAARLAERGVRVHDLNDVDGLDAYVDGADEVTATLAMTKGGGGALTREKIVAAASRTFACIADASKSVDRLGAFPLPVEVIPMARAQVVRALRATGDARGLGDTDARVRAAADGTPYVTDNGNLIVDVKGWRVDDPIAVETALGAIVGVVESGLFARRGADLLFLAGPDGVTRSTRDGATVDQTG